MRPGDFSPGNGLHSISPLHRSRIASMRPGDFSPGNLPMDDVDEVPPSCFNEAGGFLPRKRGRCRGAALRRRPRFNEAGGFLPRKLARAPTAHCLPCPRLQ